MKPQVRLLVCGGRDYGVLPVRFDPVDYAKLKAKADREKAYLNAALDKALEKYDIEIVIQGGARGADRLAGNWATSRNIPQIEEKANWDRDKKRAGPIRNQKMLEYKPTLVIAFPGGSGTADMVRRSKAANIKVIEVK